MPGRIWLTSVIVSLLSLGGIGVVFASHTGVPATDGARADDLKALDGDWLYVEDRTEGRALEDQQPGMSPRFGMRVEEDAVIVLRGQGAERREIRVALDGSVSEVAGERSNTRYHGAWKEGALVYDTEIIRPADNSIATLIRTEFRPTTEGLLVTVLLNPPSEARSVALYRHPQDIEMPTPAKAVASDLAWLAGAWVGTRGTGGTTSIEERWSPPLGGAMLCTSRTVSRDRMVAFEFLRIVERNGGLVYIAQPNGGPATEFVLTECSDTRAVFVNPRHDFPQRIVYERTEAGGLTASIGFAKGGKPRTFEFTREAP